MYIVSVINLLSWPLMVVVSYFIIRWVIKAYEKKHGASEDQAA
jgi:hypothetical protein